MKYFALAVLLTVMQAGPPVPRQKTNGSTGASKNIKNDATTKKTPSSDSALPNEPQSAPNSQEPSKAERQADTPHTAKIAEPVTVAVVPHRKDWMDKGAWVFNLLLVITSGLQVVLLCLTLRLIRHQAREATRQRVWMGRQWAIMQGQLAEISAQSGILKESVDVARDAAEASKRNVAIAINKERARIRIVRPEKLSLTVGSFATVEFKLLFYGTTPAYEVKSKVNCTISESLDSTESYLPHGIHELPTVVSASDIKPIYRDFLMKPFPLDDITLGRINNFEVFVHFSGVIKYNDFVEEPRETVFHYRWNATADSPNSLRKLGFPEGWVEVGGEKENYYT